jgi:5-methylcytosine-specific restriction endonuclease McrA
MPSNTYYQIIDTLYDNWIKCEEIDLPFTDRIKAKHIRKYASISIILYWNGTQKSVAYTNSFYPKDLEHYREQPIPTDEFKAEQRRQGALLRKKVLERDNYTCRYCGKNLRHNPSGLHSDHIKPVSKGGLSTMANLQTLCASCNLSKEAKY